ncbi:DUF2147 domain-containing protein [Inquilinus sp. CAU 1745]|uniref:DUF2147 domain-containing protein n=1 Tax=Inquilinus sp. CAU 1745 TaxID=3140369 RepID=UPI00325AAF35
MLMRAVAISALSIVGSGAVAAQELSPYGVWLRGDGNARVRIAPCGSQVCATNLWIKDTSEGEEVGDQLIMSLERKSDTELVGSAYDPKRDITYAITVTVGANSLTTRGCVLGGLLCKDVNWTPANEG